MPDTPNRKTQILLGQATAAMAGLAAAGAAREAGAAMIYTDLSGAPVVVYDSNTLDGVGQSVGLDANLDGVADLAVTHLSSAAGDPDVRIEGVNGTGVVKSGVSEPTVYGLDTLVSNAESFKTSEVMYLPSSSTGGYLAFQLPADHMGWLHMTIADPTDPQPRKVTILGYAHEDIAGLAIRTGSLVSTPEPTALSAGLVMLAAGLLPRRSGRRSAR